MEKYLKELEKQSMLHPKNTKMQLRRKFIAYLDPKSAYNLSRNIEHINIGQKKIHIFFTPELKKLDWKQLKGIKKAAGDLGEYEVFLHQSMKI